MPCPSDTSFADICRYSTVSTLIQNMLLCPLDKKEQHVIYLVNELSSASMIIFMRTVNDCHRLSIMLRRLGFPAIPLHGQMDQNLRLSSLNKFKSGGRSIMVATDVAGRGLDIPLVDLVIVSRLPSSARILLPLKLSSCGFGPLRPLALPLSLFCLVCSPSASTLTMAEL